MTNRNVEIKLADKCVRQYTARAESNEQVSEHFAELAQADRAKAEYWTQQRNRFLGEAGLQNVVSLPGMEHETGELA